jgi:hypothetical protein
MSQPSPPVHLKEIAKLIADRDTSVRNAALNAITEAFFQVTKCEKWQKKLLNKNLGKPVIPRLVKRSTR